MTWTEEYNEQFQKEMSSRYRKLAERHNCLVAPIGEKWWEGSSEPITPDELLKIDRVLKVDNVSSTTPQTGMTVKIASNDMFTYNGVYVMLKKAL